MRPLMLLCLAALLPSAIAQSIYQTKPDDPLAISANAPQFGLKGDGTTDDTAALQAAIDRVADTTGSGIVFLPAGRYRVTQTIHLWSGIRLIGYGDSRPVIVLGPNSPAFQSGHGFLGTGRYMLQFAANKPAAGAEIMDANEFTFYSGVSNVDFEIGAGNPAAICIRFHVAQHSFLDHIRFNVGQGKAALEDVGNQAENLEIIGGEYGIVSVRTSPAWQFLLMDSSIKGQRSAAIHTQEVGFTMIRDEIADTPVAVETPANMPEQLYARDLLLRNISRTGFILGDTASQHNQVTLDNIRAAHVAQLLTDPVGALGASAPLASPAPFYIVDRLTAGQEINPDGRESPIALRHLEHRLNAAPTMVASDIPAMPAVQQWTNVRTLGVKGDGGTDDTAALQAAIDSRRVIYLPTGFYRVRGTLHTKPDTVLVGLNPTTSALVVEDNDSNFAGEGVAVPMLETAQGGHEIVSGIGIYAGDGAPRAAGIVWRSGATSLLQDVNFPAGIRARPIIASAFKRPPFPPSPQRPDTRSSQYPSLWVKDGGGGLFRDIWTADTTARAGVLVENTQTTGIAYQISCEHHMHNEVQFHNASHWTIYALQTEEEKPNGAESTPVELVGSRDITFANLFDYRVSRNVLPMPTAVTSTGSVDIRFANMHNFSMTRLPFDNSLIDQTSGVRIRTHDFTVFSINAGTKSAASAPLPAVFAQGTGLKVLGNSFHDIAGLTTDTHGTLYFADATTSTISKYDEAHGVTTLTKDVPAPATLGFAGNDTLLVIDSNKQAYSVSASSGAVTKSVDGGAKPDMRLMLPVGFHNDIGSIERMVAHRGFVYAGRSNMALVSATENEPRSFFYAPGRNTALIAGGSWKGLLQAVQLKPLGIGQSALAVSEEDDKVYRVTLRSATQLDAKPFIQRGGTSVVEDAAGNIYLAGAQVFVYDRSGKQTGILETPERPISLAIGGTNSATLYIGARNSLYSIQLRK